MKYMLLKKFRGLIIILPIIFTLFFCEKILLSLKNETSLPHTLKLNPES